MNELTSIAVTQETKEEFERQRQLVPYEDSSTQDSFMTYLLEQNKRKTK